MGITRREPREYDEEDYSDEDDFKKSKKKSKKGREHEKSTKLNPKLENILTNQNKMIETLTKELRSLKDQRQEEGQIEVQKQIERLEKLLEKKEMRAEQEEFQYQLKRVPSFLRRTWLNM